jgi:2-polyprenyl-3-methyl-5-hydroxy-6-metoxy-1,4-benzoquinol methylase
VAEPWNINIHYDGKLDMSVPSHAQSVLEVGCGDGFLAARLSKRVPDVVAVDVDEPVLHRARQRFPTVPVRWMHGDVLDVADELGTFDAVVSNATLHHLADTRAALSCLRDLVRPGGTLALVTFARPVWPPGYTVTELRRHVSSELPGARVSLLPLGRVFVLWRAPAL